MIELQKLLTGLPTGLRDPLLHAYSEISANYFEHKWESSELNGGKFCECVYSVVNGALSGSYPAQPSKPRDMVQACRTLEQVPPAAGRIGDRSLRILIPRMLQALYEIRNNRGVGHVGGDVDPNFLDATTVYSMTSWVLAELVRIFHGVTTREAQEAVDSLAERKLSLIWEVEGVKRVLDSSMKKSDQALTLLYQKPGWVLDEDLLSWVEYSSLNMFRTRILRPLHTLRLVEYDEINERARISPLGAKEVEQRILRLRSPS